MPNARIAARIAAFRRFNRMYTRFLGTLDEEFLGGGFTLAESRVIYELGSREAPLAAEIAQSLGLDPGYLSRILAKLENSDLLAREPPLKKDGRVSPIRLTGSGRAGFRKLNRLSDTQAEHILEALPEQACADLIDAMARIEALLAPNPNGAPRRAPFVLRPHRPGDMGTIIAAEGAGYTKQFGWDATFEALAARIAADFIDNFDAARERCWIAETDGRHLGHIFLVRHPDQPGAAKLRLLYVEPSARGLGLGSALVAECIRFAREAGYRKVVLWTQSMLLSARKIYLEAGFRLVRESPHRSFGKDLTGQDWELEL